MTVLCTLQSWYTLSSLGFPPLSALHLITLCEKGKSLLKIWKNIDKWLRLVEKTTLDIHLIVWLNRRRIQLSTRAFLSFVVSNWIWVFEADCLGKKVFPTPPTMTSFPIGDRKADPNESFCRARAQSTTLYKSQFPADQRRFCLSLSISGVTSMMLADAFPYGI